MELETVISIEMNLMKSFEKWTFLSTEIVFTDRSFFFLLVIRIDWRKKWNELQYYLSVSHFLLFCYAIKLCDRSKLRNVGLTIWLIDDRVFCFLCVNLQPHSSINYRLTFQLKLNVISINPRSLWKVCW